LFPSFVGKQWNALYTSSIWHLDPSDRHNSHWITARVVSYEKVTVPAGTFDAFKIAANVSFGGAPREFADIIEYYSPRLGTIKYDDVRKWASNVTETHRELVNFSLAKPGS
jgi:hypothetical protein